MNTAIQELIEMYKKDVLRLKVDFESTKSLIILREASTLEMVITNLISRLDKEKKEMEDAYIQGFCECDHSGIMDFEKYYNDAFNTK